MIMTNLLYMENHFSLILRKRLNGVNLSRLSRELGISKSLLFEWKQASRGPSFKQLGSVYKLAQYFGISFQELLIGTKEDSDEVFSVVVEDQNRKYKIKILRLK